MAKGGSRNNSRLSSGGFGFEGVSDLVNARFADAIVAASEDPLHSYLSVGRRAITTHRLGIFTVATSMQALRQRTAEVFELAVPIRTMDATMPISMLGKDDPTANFFTLTYMAKRGGEKTLKVDADTYVQRFEGRGTPPVADLEYKLAVFRVMPRFDIEPDDQLAFDIDTSGGLTE